MGPVYITIRNGGGWRGREKEVSLWILGVSVAVVTQRYMRGRTLKACGAGVPAER